MLHELKVPDSKVVCKIAKRKIKKKTITCRLMMFGREAPRAVIATFKPLLREINRNGRKMRKIRSDLKKPIFKLLAMMLRRADETIIKSSMFQGSLM